jgi:hypothetical protein
MTPFEYVIVLISVILGLGITTILTGVAELIKNVKPVRLYAPYIIWIAIIFVLHFQDWWLSYQLMSVKEWSLQFFLLIVLYPINLYILAHLLFPSSSSREFDSKTFFLEHYPRIFGGSIILVVLSVIQNIFISELNIVTQVPHGLVLAVLTVILLTRNRNSNVHAGVAIFLLIVMIFGFAADQQNLVIKTNR